MSHHKIYSSFMAIIQDEVSIHVVPNNYGSQSLHIKDLITQFEYAQKYGISNKYKKLVENSNQNNILWCSSANIHCFLSH